MDKRILILSAAYPPSTSVGAFRLARFSKFLVELGWKPIVVAAADELSTTHRDDSRMLWTDPSIEVIRARPWGLPKFLDRWRRPKVGQSPALHDSAPNLGKTPGVQPRFALRAESSPRRIAHAIMLPFRIPDAWIWWAVPALCAMRRAIRKHRPGILLSSSPPHSAHLIALVAKFWTGLPLVIDLRDPWVESTWKGASNSRLKLGSDRALERACVNRADKVILNTPELLADFQQRYAPRLHDKFVVIPNGYDPQIRATIESLVQMQPEKPLSAPLLLCHAGSVYGRRDIRPLIEAVALLNRQGRHVMFEQIGGLADPAAIRACVEQNDASSFVRIERQQSHEEVLRRMAAADILVVVRQNTALQAPAKLYEMMLFGKPILALDDEGATSRLVRRYDLGEVADPVDPHAIAKAISQAAEQMATPLSPRRQEALAAFDSRSQVKELAEVLTAALQSPHTTTRP